MSPQRSEFPLTIADMGQILTQGILLYRQNWKVYMSLAARAYGWFLVPFYGWTRYVALKAEIARLAFAQLAHESLSPDDIHAETQRCRSKLLWLSLRVWWQVVVAIAVNLLLAFIASVLLLSLAMVALGTIDAIYETSFYTSLDKAMRSPDPGATPPIGALILGVFVIAFPTLQSLLRYGELLDAELSLLLDSELSIRTVIKFARQWKLGGRMKLMGLMWGTALLGLPLFSVPRQLLQLIFSVIRGFNGATLSDYFDAFSGSLFVGIFANVPPFLLCMLLLVLSQLHLLRGPWILYQILAFGCLLAGAIAVLPLWQSVKAALHYRIRCATEGLDLQLRS